MVVELSFSSKFFEDKMNLKGKGSTSYSKIYFEEVSHVLCLILTKSSETSTVSTRKNRAGLTKISRNKTEKISST